MAPSVRDILRQTGFTEEEIGKLDRRLTEGFETVLTEAGRAQAASEAAKAEAQEAERRYQYMYANEIVPALNSWGSEKATLTAERDFYRQQNEGARTAGFLPKDAPGYTPSGTPPPSEAPRGSDGRYVSGGNPVPGSPALQLNDVMRGISNSQWATQEYQRLYGEPLPEDYDFYQTLEEATRSRMEFRDFMARKYKFAEKRKEVAEIRQKEHDEAIRKDERSKVEKEWAERGGSNPNVRTAQASQYAGVRKAVESGKAKDPLMMSPDQRRQQTRDMIRSEIVERESQGSA